MAAGAWAIAGEAYCHLSRADPILRRLIARIGSYTLTLRRDYFATLCDSIISQQLSAAVAAAIFDRFAALYLRRRPTPPAVAVTPAVRLHAAGLSRQKITYLKDLAGRAFKTAASGRGGSDAPRTKQSVMRWSPSTASAAGPPRCF